MEARKAAQAGGPQQMMIKVIHWKTRQSLKGCEFELFALATITRKYLAGAVPNESVLRNSLQEFNFGAVYKGFSKFPEPQFN
jgi:hypothetical protein